MVIIDPASKKVRGFVFGEVSGETGLLRSIQYMEDVVVVLEKSTAEKNSDFSCPYRYEIKSMKEGGTDG
jgi:hypothetical protein